MVEVEVVVVGSLKERKNKLKRLGVKIEEYE